MSDEGTPFVIPPDDGKPWYKSKTCWTTTLLVVASLWSTFDEEILDFLSRYPRVGPLVGVLACVAFALLRIWTNTAITVKPFKRRATKKDET